MIKVHYDNVAGITIEHSSDRCGDIEFTTSHTFNYDAKSLSKIIGMNTFLLEAMSITGLSGTFPGAKLISDKNDNVSANSELEVYKNFLSDKSSLEEMLKNELYSITKETFEKVKAKICLAKVLESVDRRF